jgi:hypothetical protein
MRIREKKRKNFTYPQIDRRADKRLDGVAQYFCDVLGGELTKEEPLHKEIRIDGRPALRDLTLSYDVENRFAAVSYDLVLSTQMDCVTDETMRFALKNRRFEGVVASDSPECRTVLERLNTKEVLGRIKDLNYADVIVHHNAEESCCTIKLKGILGGSTWMLIPPLMETIRFDEEEVRKTAELVELMQCSFRF